MNSPHPTSPPSFKLPELNSPILSGSGDGASADQSWALSLGMIEAVSEASDRDAAIIAMVSFASKQFPNCRVYCGLGGTKLKRYYDHELGWLGPSSERFQAASEEWEDETATLPTRPSLPTEHESPKSNQTGQPLRLNIDDLASVGRCVLWVEGDSLTPADRTWLKRSLPSLRALIWQHKLGLVANLLRALSSSGMTTRVYLGLATLFIMVMALWPVSYRVRCTTVVRPQHSRIVSAPFNAVLKETHVEPGDQVRRGQVLLTLDGTPLTLELATVEAQIGQVEKERDIAMVAGRIAESQQAKLRIRELARRRDLLLNRLQRLQVTSPIDGVVVFGDLTRSIGAPLDTGQAVIEVAPLENMVIELEIPEHEIRFVKKGTLARVRLAANDGGAIEKPVDVIYPSAELRDDCNVFVAKIDVENRDGQLRPGMRGDAIAYGPIRPWLWSLARSGWEKTLWWVGF